MKTVKLTVGEIRALGYFLSNNPCSSGCCYVEMQNSDKDCDNCKLTKDRDSILEKLGLL